MQTGECARGLTCVRYYGVAGARGPQMIVLRDQMRRRRRGAMPQGSGMHDHRRRPRPGVPCRGESLTCRWRQHEEAALYHRRDRDRRLQRQRRRPQRIDDQRRRRRARAGAGAVGERRAAAHGARNQALDRGRGHARLRCAATRSALGRRRRMDDFTMLRRRRGPGRAQPRARAADPRRRPGVRRRPRRPLGQQRLPRRRRQRADRGCRAST